MVVDLECDVLVLVRRHERVGGRPIEGARQGGVHQRGELCLLVAEALLAFDLAGPDGLQPKQGEGQCRRGDEQAEDPPPGPVREGRVEAGKHPSAYIVSAPTAVNVRVS